MLDSQDYIMYIINEHEILPTNHPTHVYIDRVINRLVFKIKDWHKVELQMSEILKLFGSPKKVIDKTKKGENVASIEVVEVVLKQCGLVDNQYQQKSEVLNTFMHNKSYAYLLNVESSNLVFLKSYNAEFDGNVVTFTDQNVRPWEVEGKVNLKLLINKYKWCVTPQNQEQENMSKGMDFYVLQDGNHGNQ